MFKIFLALHLVAAVFAIGPLVHAATTAGRGVRQGDAAATTSSARMLRIYSYASVVVVILGFGLMSAKSDHNTVEARQSGVLYGTHETTAKFTETWIWLSVLLWLVAVGVVLAVLVPALQKTTEMIGRSEPVAAMTARVAAGGGVVALIFAGIVFLMVYRPGG